MAMETEDLAGRVVREEVRAAALMAKRMGAGGLVVEMAVVARGAAMEAVLQVEVGWEMGAVEDKARATLAANAVAKVVPAGARVVRVDAMAKFSAQAIRLLEKALGEAAASR